MKKLIFSLFLLCGCDMEFTYEQSDWETAPREHICTEEQMKKVMEETDFCNDNTSYFSTYCYGAAILRNCEKIEKNVIGYQE